LGGFLENQVKRKRKVIPRNRTMRALTLTLFEFNFKGRFPRGKFFINLPEGQTNISVERRTSPPPLASQLLRRSLNAVNLFFCRN
jgi:hypothetical protein